MAMVDKFTLSRQVEEIKGTLIDHWQPKTGVWKSIQKKWRVVIISHRIKDVITLWKTMVVTEQFWMESSWCYGF